MITRRWLLSGLGAAVATGAPKPPVIRSGLTYLGPAPLGKVIWMELSTRERVGPVVRIADRERAHRVAWVLDNAPELLQAL